MNPCPCGYLGGERCRCTPEQVRRYQARLSGPLLDRIDMLIGVQPVDEATLMRRADGEPSATIAARVARARQRQLTRQGKPNAYLTPPEIDRHCALDDAAAALLRRVARRQHWSSRALHRVHKLARTIADLCGEEPIGATRVAEAVGYRRALDRRRARPLVRALQRQRQPPLAAFAFLVGHLEAVRSRQRHHVAVVGEGGADQFPIPGRACGAHHPFEQRVTQALALPGVGDDDAELGRLRLSGRGKARHAEDLDLARRVGVGPDTGIGAGTALARCRAAKHRQCEACAASPAAPAARVARRWPPSPPPAGAGTATAPTGSR